MTRNAERSNLTDRLRRALTDAGVSHRAAGAMLGKSDAYVGRRLSGEVPLSLDDLAALAAAAGLTAKVTLEPVDR